MVLRSEKEIFKLNPAVFDKNVKEMRPLKYINVPDWILYCRQFKVVKPRLLLQIQVLQNTYQKYCCCI